MLSGPSLTNVLPREPEIVTSDMRPDPCGRCGGPPVASASGDFTGDGTSDLLLGCCESLEVRVIRPNLLSFLVPLRLPPGAVLSDARFVGDLNRDGFGDVAAILATGGASAIKVFYGSATGMTGATTSTPPDTSTVYNTLLNGAADVNGDGFNDLVVSANSTQVLVYQGTANGVNLASPSHTTLAAMPGQIAQGVSIRAGEYTGDGLCDVGYITGIRPNQSALVSIERILLGDSSQFLSNLGAFQSTTVDRGLSTTFMLAMSGGDLDGDGFDDFVWPQRAGTASPYTWTMHREAGAAVDSSRGRQLFTAPDLSQFGGFLQGAASPGDTDGDGYDDVAFGVSEVNGTNQPGYLLLRGGATEFGSVTTRSPTPSTTSASAGVFE